jgi:methylmalonyl-CoA mutase
MVTWSNFGGIKEKIGDRKVPVIGITGTGGAGKSSLTDELILRMLHDLKDIRIAIVSADPSRVKPAAPCWATAFA